MQNGLFMPQGIEKGDNSHPFFEWLQHLPIISDYNKALIQINEFCK